MPRKAYGKGGNKAYRAMLKRYGTKKGKQVFYAKANKYGKRGTSRTQKIRKTYGKGVHLTRRKRSRRK